MTPAAAGILQTLVRSVEATFNAGDAAALANLYTDDAVLMPPDAPTVVGAEGIKSYYQALFDQFTATEAISVDESGLLGDWAFGRGTFIAMLKPKAGGEVLQIPGKWMNLFSVQGDGSWKTARHIWNLPTPPLVTSK